MTSVNGELLTPEFVRTATFSPARLGRRGLDEGQVHAFCGWVSDELGQVLSENAMLHEEVQRLRSRILDGSGNGDSGIRPEDGQVQAVYVLSKAQQTADRYVADAQEYSREIAVEARKRHDDILREAQVRASMILDEAHERASQAANAVQDTREPLPGPERQQLQAEIAYLRTFSDVCRTHLRAYMESLTRSIEEWERAERQGAPPPKAPGDSRLQPAEHVLSRTTVGLLWRVFEASQSRVTTRGSGGRRRADCGGGGPDGEMTARSCGDPATRPEAACIWDVCDAPSGYTARRKTPTPVSVRCPSAPPLFLLLRTYRRDSPAPHSPAGLSDVLIPRNQDPGRITAARSARSSVSSLGSNSCT